MISTTINIVDDAKHIYQTLAPQIFENERCATKLSLQKDKLKIHIDAKDFPSFRAGMSSIMNGLTVYNKVKGL